MLAAAVGRSRFGNVLWLAGAANAVFVLPFLATASHPAHLVNKCSEKARRKSRSR
jgi:hypothetical protein